MNITKEEYAGMVKKAAPASPVLADCVWAFFTGGAICCLGEALSQLFESMGLGEEPVKMAVPVTLVFLSALATGLGLYPKLAKHAGAGTLVPITGFANAVVSPAIEFQADESDIIYPSQTSLHNFQGECDLVQK